MSETAPERTAGGGNPLTRSYGGVPAWGWIAGVAAAIGAYVYIRSRNAGNSASTSTAQGTSVTGTAPDTSAQQSEYEQLSAELTGIEGNQAALLAAIKDLQGATGTTGDNDGRQDARQEARQDARQEARQDRRQRPGPVRRRNPAPRSSGKAPAGTAARNNSRPAAGSSSVPAGKSTAARPRSRKARKR